MGRGMNGGKGEAKWKREGWERKGVEVNRLVAELFRETEVNGEK